MAGSVAAMPATGRWVVDFADHQCVASRTFGDKDNPWTLAIKPSPTSDVVQLFLIKKGGSWNAVQEEAQLSFGKAPPIKVKQLRYANKDMGLRMINLSAEQARVLAEAEVVEWAGDGPDKSFSMGPIEKLMATLATCRSDLREYWNITPEKRDALKSGARPRKPLIRYFTSGDYPRQAMSNDEAGLTSVALLIDEQGAIKDCMVDATSNVATLDAMSCIILRERSKFDPAIGADGKPSRSYYIQRIRWELP